MRDEVGLTASVGVATTKLVAKVASDLRKPDGLVVVPPGEEAAFLAPLPIRRLWGVGEQTRAVLAEHGVRTIGDLAELPVDVLVRRLGAHGAILHERARGIDPSPVTGDVAAKSVSHEHTFDVDTADAEVIERTLLALSEGVASRLRAGGVRASTVAVKVRDSGFHTVTRQRTLPEPTDLADPIFRTALELVRPEVAGPPDPAARGRARTVSASRPRWASSRRRIRAGGRPSRRRTRSAASSAAGALTRARLLGDPLADPGGRDPLQPLEGRRVGRARPGADPPRHRGRPSDEGNPDRGTLTAIERPCQSRWHGRGGHSPSSTRGLDIEQVFDLESRFESNRCSVSRVPRVTPRAAEKEQRRWR